MENCPTCNQTISHNGMIEKKTISVGALTLDVDTQIASVFGRVAKLSAQEMKLLALLMVHKSQILTREIILKHLWSVNERFETRIVDVYIGYLRTKLGSQTINSVRGVGYTLNLKILEGKENNG